jgi:hypothetical protein
VGGQVQLPLQPAPLPSSASTSELFTFFVAARYLRSAPSGFWDLRTADCTLRLPSPDVFVLWSFN